VPIAAFPLIDNAGLSYERPAQGDKIRITAFDYLLRSSSFNPSFVWFSQLKRGKFAKSKRSFKLPQKQ